MSSVTGAMCVTVYRCISITPPRAREVTKLPQRFAGSWVLMLNAVKFLFWRQKMPQSQKYQCFKWKVKQSKYLHPPPTLPGNKAFPTQGGGGGGWRRRRDAVGGQLAKAPAARLRLQDSVAAAAVSLLGQRGSPSICDPLTARLTSHQRARTTSSNSY